MDPSRDWERLRARYAAMSEQELLELRDDYDSLTEVAQEGAGGRTAESKFARPRREWLRGFPTESVGENAPSIHPFRAGP
jgi:hypothetical protein